MDRARAIHSWIIAERIQLPVAVTMRQPECPYLFSLSVRHCLGLSLATRPATAFPPPWARFSLSLRCPLDLVAINAKISIVLAKCERSISILTSDFRQPPCCLSRSRSDSRDRTETFEMSANRRHNCGGQSESINWQKAIGVVVVWSFVDVCAFTYSSFIPIFAENIALKGRRKGYEAANWIVAKCPSQVQRIRFSRPQWLTYAEVRRIPLCWLSERASCSAMCSEVWICFRFRWKEEINRWMFWSCSAIFWFAGWFRSFQNVITRTRCDREIRSGAENAATASCTRNERNDVSIFLHFLSVRRFWISFWTLFAFSDCVRCTIVTHARVSLPETINLNILNCNDI